MADNLTVPNVGVVGTDDVGGVHYQRTKPVHGPDGTATDTSGPNPLPVSEPEQTFTNTADISVDGDTELFAAVGSAVTRRIVVPPSADTGIRIAFGATPTGTSALLPAGFVGQFRTRQQIKGIKAGAAAVTVSRFSSVDA